MPDAFRLPGGEVGCLLLHGYSGSPPEMRGLAEYLNARGIAVSAPLLPGHGTRPDDLNHVRWEEWLDTAEGELRALRQAHRDVFVSGLSMGALLAAHLAIMFPDVRGMILYSPVLRAAHPLLPLAPVLRHVIKQFPVGKSARTQYVDPDARKRMWHYATYPVGGAAQLLRLQRVVRRELMEAKTPALIFHTTRDTAIHPTSAQEMFDRLGSRDKELVTLNNSGHCMTVDSECAQIFARSYGFIVTYTRNRRQNASEGSA